LQDVKTAYVRLVHSNVQFNKYHAESKSTLRFFNKNKQGTVVPMRPVSVAKLCGQTRVKIYNYFYVRYLYALFSCWKRLNNFN